LKKEKQSRTGKEAAGTRTGVRFGGNVRVRFDKKDELLKAKVFGSGKWRRLKAAGAEIGSEGSKAKS
jgi:hypothetical protein